MPRGYYPRAGVNRWTAEQKERLERMALARQPWPRIAEECGHPEASCKTTLSYIRRQRRRAAELAQAAKPRVFMQQPIFPLPEPTGRHRSISTLISDAELRARIEILGPNGLLGDPLPGRSALDQKSRHGAVRPTPASSASASGATPASDADALFMDNAT